MANQRLNIDIVARDKSQQALGKLQGNLQRVRQSVFNLRNAFIGLGAGIVLKGFFNAGVQIENLEVQLNALFKSADKGKNALKTLTAFAATTPFELSNIQQGVTALVTVRKQAEEAGISFEELLTITGNTAVILGGDFALAALQIQRSFSAGISSAELFRERGVKAMAGFKEGVSINGKQSAIGLKKAFGKNGEFGKLMEDLAQTTFGTITNLKDAFFIFQVDVAQGFFGALKENLGDLKKTVEANRKEIAEFGAMIGAGLSSAIQFTAKAAKLLKDNLNLIIEAVKILIAFKLIKFFFNLSTAIMAARGSMLLFNKAVKKNLLIAGAAVLITQLDNIIKKIREIRGISEETIETDVAPSIDIKKQIPEASMIDKINFQFQVLFKTIEDGNKNKLEKFRDNFKKIGEIVGTSINNGITKMSDGIARSIILGENLANTFKKMAQELAIKVLSAIIEIIARKTVELAIEKLITREKEKQAKLSQQEAMGSTFSSLFSFAGKFFDKGGAVSKGQPVVVGERGAELFIPNQTGQITQSARGTGTGNVNVNFAITTLDASGFQDMLIQNRGTISNIINQAVNERGSNNLV
jgi:hypothetical protein